MWETEQRRCVWTYHPDTYLQRLDNRVSVVLQTRLHRLHRQHTDLLCCSATNPQWQYHRAVVNINTLERLFIASFSDQDGWSFINGLRVFGSGVMKSQWCIWRNSGAERFQIEILVPYWLLKVEANNSFSQGLEKPEGPCLLISTISCLEQQRIFYCNFAKSIFKILSSQEGLNLRYAGNFFSQQMFLALRFGSACKAMKSKAVSRC